MKKIKLCDKFIQLNSSLKKVLKVKLKDGNFVYLKGYVVNNLRRGLLQIEMHNSIKGLFEMQGDIDDVV